MQKVITKNHVRNQPCRSLKIQPQIRINRRSVSKFPEIKLRGNWLEKLGFIPEQRVSITTLDKLLIIRVED